MGSLDVWLPRIALSGLCLVALAGTCAISYMGIQKEEIPPAVATITGSAVTALVLVAQGGNRSGGNGQDRVPVGK